MKIALALTVVVILSAIQVVAQGTVDIRATVRNPDGSLVTSSQGYLGELVFAPDGTAADQFNTFAVRLGGASTVGVPLPGALFSGGARTVSAIAPGGFGLFQVRVWRGSDGTDWRSVMATGNPNFLVAESPILRIQTSIPPALPTPVHVDLTLHPVPEPSAIALALLAVSACFVVRRRK